EGFEYTAPVPSAQVKSAILLAGLYAAGETAVVEPVKTRDHTEVMLGAMGAEVKVDGPRVAVSRTERLEPIDIAVPGDFSSAAFWLVAGGLVEAADIRLLGVGGDAGRDRHPGRRLGHHRTAPARRGESGLGRRSPHRDGSGGRRPHRGRQDRDRGRGVRRDLVPGFLRSSRIPVLKVRCEIDVDIVALELYELEVTAPREDFELEVKRAMQAVRAGTIGPVDRARELYRRFGVDTTKMRPSSEALGRRMKQGEPLPRINS